MPTFTGRHVTTASQTAETDASTDRNWNLELQQLLESSPGREKYPPRPSYRHLSPHVQNRMLCRYAQIAALTRDFNFVAETFGKIIISELALPQKGKTIPPLKDAKGTRVFVSNSGSRRNSRG
jgi:hypothetical protein